MFISLTMGADGAPVAVMNRFREHRGFKSLFIRESWWAEQQHYQNTCSIPNDLDIPGIPCTDSSSLFIPKLLVTDLLCNEGEVQLCFETKAGLANDAWSLDNDFRFDTMDGHIRAVNYVTEKIITILNLMKPYWCRSSVESKRSRIVLRFKSPAPPGAFTLYLAIMTILDNNLDSRRWRTVLDYWFNCITES